MSEWTSPERALEHLSRADEVPHRVEGEAVLLEMLPETVARVLDLGAGRLPSAVGRERPSASGVALDYAIHHLEDGRKRALYEEVLALLELALLGGMKPAG